VARHEANRGAESPACRLGRQEQRRRSSAVPRARASLFSGPSHTRYPPFDTNPALVEILSSPRPVPSNRRLSILYTETRSTFVVCMQLPSSVGPGHRIRELQVLR